MRIGQYCHSIGLEVGGLVFQSSRWNETNENLQKTQLTYFAKCAETTKALRATTISCIIPILHGARLNRAGSPSEKMAYNLPVDYSWQRDWDNYICQMSAACDIAADFGLRLCLIHAAC